MSELVMIIIGIALLLGLMLLSLSKTPPTKRKQLDKQMVSRKWNKIKDTAAAPNDSARLAVIEADKLLDYVLKARGYRGEAMGDRLKEAGSDFSHLDDVWEAHKLRNKLVHETEYEADRRLIDKSIKQFRQALKDLGAL